MPTYNGAAYIHEALESLLVQSDPRFVIVACDDGSTDDTMAILQGYARKDPRVRPSANTERLGMVLNWRRAFELGREWAPDAPYFMWASDHDVWHPRFVSVLTRHLDGHPETVLAYPLSQGIDDNGNVVRHTFEFCTVHDERDARIRQAHFGMSAGNMVYGMFRAEALRACGVYRRTLLPDRLLLTELAALGHLHQVPQQLWLRRYRAGEKASYARQRASFWPDRTPPLWSRLPWWLVHPVQILVNQALLGRGRPLVSREDGAWLARVYLPTAFEYAARRRVTRVSARRRKLRKDRRKEWTLLKRDFSPAVARSLERHPRGRVWVWTALGSYRVLRNPRTLKKIAAVDPQEKRRRIKQRRIDAKRAKSELPPPEADGTASNGASASTEARRVT